MAEIDLDLEIRMYLPTDEYEACYYDWMGNKINQFFTDISYESAEKYINKLRSDYLIGVKELCWIARVNYLDEIRFFRS